jgi:DNA-binding transcriptional ArsR family regulator
MPIDEEITFADHMGRFMARRYSFAPMVGRLLGYLAICDPREQSIAELADALLASRSAISGALKTLENLHYVRRTRSAGDRMDKVVIDAYSPQAYGFDPSEYEEMGALAREGLKVLGDNAPPDRRSALAQTAAFADFLAVKLPELGQEWEAHVARLRAAGELPEPPRN